MEYELYHHGIKGQKWGIRRFQNSDGTLTEAGKKRYNQQVNKSIRKIDKALSDQHAKNYIDAYNKAADKVNNGLIDLYNQEYKKKYGDYDDGRYIDLYQDLFTVIQTQEYNKIQRDSIQKSKGYKKVKSLVDKYGKQNLDSINAGAIDRIKDLMESDDSIMKFDYTNPNEWDKLASAKRKY